MSSSPPPPPSADSLSRGASPAPPVPHAPAAAMVPALLVVVADAKGLPGERSEVGSSAGVSRVEGGREATGRGDLEGRK